MSDWFSMRNAIKAKVNSIIREHMAGDWSWSFVPHMEPDACVLRLTQGPRVAEVVINYRGWCDDYENVRRIVSGRIRSIVAETPP